MKEIAGRNSSVGRYVNKPEPNADLGVFSFSRHADNHTLSLHTVQTEHVRKRLGVSDSESLWMDSFQDSMGCSETRKRTDRHVQAKRVGFSRGSSQLRVWPERHFPRGTGHIRRRINPNVAGYYPSAKTRWRLVDDIGLHAV